MNTVGNAKPSRPAAPRANNPTGAAGSNRKPFRPGPLNNGTDRVSYSKQPSADAEKGTARG